MIVAENMRGMLRSFGYSVPPPATSGEEAIRRVETARPDLVLIDLQLQDGIDGVQTAEQIRSRFDVPVVYLTAYTDDRTLQRATATEPYGYIVKPFAVGELRCAIETALQRYELYRKAKESEARYRGIVEAQAELVLRLSPVGTLIFVNEACCRFFGKPREELIGQDFLSLIAADDRSATRERLSSLTRKNPSTTADSRVETGGGKPAVVWWDYQAIFSAQGRLFEFQVVGRDYTGRWQAEKRLKERNAFLEQINKASQAFVSSLDLDQVLATILEELRKQLRVVASSVWLTDPETNELVCHYATEPSSKMVRGWRLAPGQGIAGWVAETGQSEIVPDLRSHRRHFGGVDDQTKLDLASMVAVPLRVKERVIGVIEVMDRRPGHFSKADLGYVEVLAQAASVAVENAYLYQEARRLRAFNEDIVQSMDEGIVLESEAGVITFVNPRLAGLLGYGAQELVGRQWTDILAPDQVPTITAERSRWPGVVTGRYETALLTRDGERVPVIVSARSLFRDLPEARDETLDPRSGTRYVGMLSVFTDIRERKQSEQALQRRLETEQMIASLSTRFINAAAERTDEELHFALKSIGEFLGVDHSFLDLLNSDGDAVEQMHEWHAAGVAASPNGHLGLSLQGLPWAAERLLISEIVNVPHITRLPAEAAAEKAFMQGQGIQSMVCVPLAQGQRLVGLLGLCSYRGERQWSEDDTSLLRLMAGIFMNVLAHRRAEEQVQTSLREKEVLLKEIHHRVKNNLQVICSLVGLQGDMVDDPHAIQAFEDTQNRVRSMALIHEKLYQSADLSRIDAAEYIRELSEYLVAAYAGVRQDIALIVKADHASLEIDVTIPCALIINELVSNAVRHAFPPGWEKKAGSASPRPTIRVDFQHDRETDRFSLMVRDNGVGLQPDFDLSRLHSLGLQLVAMLTEQMGGTLAIERDDGTAFRIAFQGGPHGRPKGLQETRELSQGGTRSARGEHSDPPVRHHD
jgi:PAS domain S-box-containing protein